MKKIYQIPTTEIVNVELQQMIADSVEGFEGSLGTGGASGNDGLSRGSDWDDEY